MNLEGKNILITGAGGFGVGSGICRALAEYGARLIVNDRTVERCRAAQEAYPGSIPAVADIADHTQVEALFAGLEKEVGVLHGLVNNAGVGLSKVAHEASEQEFEHLYGVDVKAVWTMSKFFAAQLLRNRIPGNIVNVSSVHARATITRYALYASAKSAVEGLTRGMAVELGKHGIRVNAIAPGYVHAEQNEELIRTWTDDPRQWVQDYIENEQVIPRAIQPVDCGYAVAFLLSDLSRSITGQTIYVDNGDTIKLLGSLSR
jgi:NAD(P)-dependent dehydrogenase (short-subunit alcohol dehydrogenase family)